MFLRRFSIDRTMATAKTGAFYLTETVALAGASPPGSRNQGTIDLGAYVNVPTGQAVAVESVDFIYQDGADFSSTANLMLAGSGGIAAQLTDLNPGTVFVRADDQSLIASGSVNIDQPNNVASHTTDLFPDSFGTLSDAFMVVNDTLYLVIGNDVAAIAGSAVYVTARIRCRVVKLSSKDWMALALQSVASDS